MPIFYTVIDAEDAGRKWYVGWAWTGNFWSEATSNVRSGEGEKGLDF